jgi:hypothetical protein
MQSLPDVLIGFHGLITSLNDVIIADHHTTPGKSKRN